MNETSFKKELMYEIEAKNPGSIILKNDPNHNRGIPDLTILFPNGRWAALEIKKSKDSHHQPLQDYYIKRMNNMSFASFIFPENKKEVLDELERSFKEDTKG